MEFDSNTYVFVKHGEIVNSILKGYWLKIPGLL